VVERILGRKADRLILVAVNIDREALERARELGVDVVYGGVVE
jgi:post-segregation antitoxin (ccd killing protein)